ncbi:MAG TPA: hypothetical protein VGN42_18525 [Pirellulales bacterium]|nr:hypothetical protein [Pirellulales bacterium]
MTALALWRSPTKLVHEDTHLNIGMAVGGGEDRRRNLSASITVDAGRVDEEIAGDVLGHLLEDGRHGAHFKT